MSETDEYPTWWTNCPTCDIGVTITLGASAKKRLPDPDGGEEFLKCPYDGSYLEGWNGDE